MPQHTNNRLQTHWKEACDFIKKAWPRFTDVQLGRINGDYDKFCDYLREYYGGFPLSEASARAQLKRLFDVLDEKRFTDSSAT